MSDRERRGSDSPVAVERDGTDAGRIVFTVGHGAGSFGDLQQRLAPHRIQMIIDVRSEPSSRHAPDFSRPELDQECAEAGFGYRWLGDRLGGRPGDPALHTAAGEPDPVAIAASAGFAAGIDEILGLAGTERVVLLCAELAPPACHRSSILATALEQRGIAVHHVLRDGSAHRHQPALDL